MTGRSLLAVFAHPDDESLACGGLLARCAMLGAQVSLLCATRGEGARRIRPAQPLVIGGLGDIRARELEAAARILGVTDVVMLDYEDGMLPWVDAAKLEGGHPRDDQPSPSGRRHHLRRGRPLLAPGSHRDSRADDGGRRRARRRTRRRCTTSPCRPGACAPSWTRGGRESRVVTTPHSRDCGRRCLRRAGRGAHARRRGG